MELGGGRAVDWYLNVGGNHGSRRTVMAAGNSDPHSAPHVGARLAPLSHALKSPAICRAFLCLIESLLGATSVEAGLLLLWPPRSLIRERSMKPAPMPCLRLDDGRHRDGNLPCLQGFCLPFEFRSKLQQLLSVQSDEGLRQAYRTSSGCPLFPSKPCPARRFLGHDRILEGLANVHWRLGVTTPDKHYRKCWDWVTWPEGAGSSPFL